MVKRGRPAIKPHIEKLIVSRVSEDREKPRKEWTPRKALAFELQREIEGMDEPAPELSTLEKRISDYSNKIKPEPEDNPWSVSALALADYDIPAEAVPVVMKAWARALEEEKPLTIRQARWIGRLYYLLKDKGTNFLIERALKYASREKAIKLTGDYPEKPQNMSWLWYGDALLYFASTGDDSPLQAVSKSIKWQTTKDLAELKEKLKIEQKEVIDHKE